VSVEPIVDFRGVAKRFGAAAVVHDVSFTIAGGEFFSLLGPSGCGKTTTLRLLAGFETPDAGEIRIGGELVNARRPYERPLAMVFQNYALFPHLSVERNVAFGLEERRVPAAQIADRVARALALVQLDPATFAKRRPAQLSGGQKQRVALARALVLEPALLLLDEPLAALDLQLRKAMQTELKALHRQLGTTFVFVTHDQEEALVLSDRIAVMQGGRLVQVGTPAEIYENPRTAFVAEFIGETNLLDGTVGACIDGATPLRRVTDARARTWLVPDRPFLRDGAPVRVAVRPEWLDLCRPDAVPAGENALVGTVRDIVYLGETLHVVLDIGDAAPLRVALRNEGLLQNPLAWRIGDAAAAAWRPDDAEVLEG
jgi:spermidine/putrescine ABC transporter ATP-binding subunit